tara:strand:- start:453 stop:848 length:396 start_codon:yes stop_codon:yes gene_type:complete
MLKRNFNFYSLLSLLFLIGFVTGNIFHVPYKYAIKKIYAKDYQTSMYKCDNAMRNQFIAKAKIIKKPDQKTAKALEAAEIALIDCHEYDVLRKKLLSLGLVSLDLSSMGLEAIEREAFDLQKLVRIHEIRY